MFVAGVEGCRAPEGWVCFKVEVPSLITSAEVIDLPSWLRNRPSNLAFLGIDIPIALPPNDSRACDKEARKCLVRPRGSSVFPPPCRAVLVAQTYAEACAINRRKMGKRLSQQAFHIGKKIKQVDDVMTPERQQWAFEVHPRFASGHSTGNLPRSTTRGPKRAETKESISCVHTFPISSDFWTPNLRESARMICSTRLLRLGLRCGGTGVKRTAFAHLNVTSEGWK